MILVGEYIVFVILLTSEQAFSSSFLALTSPTNLRNARYLLIILTNALPKVVSSYQDNLTLSSSPRAGNVINNILTTLHDCTELYLSSNPLPKGGIQLPRRQNFSLRYLGPASSSTMCSPHHMIVPKFSCHPMPFQEVGFNFRADQITLSDILKSPPAASPNFPRTLVVTYST